MTCGPILPEIRIIPDLRMSPPLVDRKKLLERGALISSSGSNEHSIVEMIR